MTRASPEQELRRIATSYLIINYKTDQRQRINISLNPQPQKYSSKPLGRGETLHPLSSPSQSVWFIDQQAAQIPFSRTAVSSRRTGERVFMHSFSRDTLHHLQPSNKITTDRRRRRSRKFSSLDYLTRLVRPRRTSRTRQTRPESSPPSFHASVYRMCAHARFRSICKWMQ